MLVSNTKDKRKVLLLNAAEEIIGIVSWQKAVTLYMNGKADAPYNFDGFYEISTPHGQVFQLPSVLVLGKFVYIPDRKVVVTRRNVLRRDQFMCQYCETELLEAEIATIDHIQPVSRGGKTEWTNVVACCKKCNSKKGSRTPEEAGMKLRIKPMAPSKQQLLQSLALHIRKNEEWSRWYKSPVIKVGSRQI